MVILKMVHTSGKTSVAILQFTQNLHAFYAKSPQGTIINVYQLLALEIENAFSALKTVPICKIVLSEYGKKVRWDDTE